MKVTFQNIKKLNIYDLQNYDFLRIFSTKKFVKFVKF